MRKRIAGSAAAAALLTCLGAPIAFFRGSLDEMAFQWLFAMASILWFVSATTYASTKH